MPQEINIAYVPQEIDVIVQPTEVTVELADPNKIGPPGATIVSARVNNTQDLELLMSDSRILVVNGFKFATGVQTVENTVPSESLSALRVVSRQGDYIVYADSSNLDTVFTVLGITLTSGSGELYVLNNGILEDPFFSFTPYKPLFLNTLGFFSHTPPAVGSVLQIGTAISSTKMMVSIGTPFIL